MFHMRAFGTLRATAKLTTTIERVSFFSTTSNVMGRVNQVFERIPKNIPTVKLPAYLIDKEITRCFAKGGRGPLGQIIQHHVGGGAVRNYRKIDHMRMPLYKKDEAHKNNHIYTEEVVSICYDPNRTARIALVIGDMYDKYKLVLAAEGMQPGHTYHISRGPPIAMKSFQLGDTFPVKYFPVGSQVYNIEKKLGAGGEYARAAGMFMTVHKVYQQDGRIMVDLFERKQKRPKIRTVDGECLACYGTVSNSIHHHRKLYKAGQGRRLNKRPSGVIGRKRHFSRKPKRMTRHQLNWAKSRAMYYARRFFLPHRV